jgi:hypothetical protein
MSKVVGVISIKISLAMVREGGHMVGHYVFLLQHSSRPENKNKVTKK